LAKLIATNLYITALVVHPNNVQNPLDTFPV